MFAIISSAALAIALFVVILDFLWRHYVNPSAGTNPWADMALPEDGGADEPAEAEPAREPLRWKPVRVVPISLTEHSRGYVKETEDAIEIHALYGMGEEALAGLEACLNFTLADLEPHVSYLGGTRTAGYFSHGIITGWEEGQYFTYDGPNDGSMLWSNLVLFRGPLVDAARERAAEERRRVERLARAWRRMAEEGELEDGACTPPCLYDSEGEIPTYAPLKRTDSGSNYGFTGFPDVAFWQRSGCPLYWRVDAGLYSSWDEPARGHPERVRYIQQCLADNDERLRPLEKKAMKEQLERMRDEYAEWCAAQPEQEAAALLERLDAAWELREAA